MTFTRRYNTMRKSFHSSRSDSPSFTRPAVRNEKPKGGYVALAWYPFGQNDARIMSANGKIILYDTVVIAQQHIPQFGGGRIASWSADGETCCFIPIDPRGVNRVDIVTDYDPYNLPANMPDGIRSETHGKEWRSHLMWTAVFFDCGQFARQSDGTYINAALGEQHILRTAGASSSG